MEPLTVLWINFTRSRQAPELAAKLSKHCSIEWLSDNAEIDSKIQQVSPHVLCFDYDYPDAAGLLTLQQTKAAFPSIPILMLTEYHSESLAVWAFRSRVWDYLVKPVAEKDLQSRLSALFEVLKNRQKSASRNSVTAHSTLDITIERLGPGKAQRLVLMAKAYMEQHLSEDIDASTVAAHCNMSYFHFSRTFKRIYGESFSEFVLKARIKKAADLLHAQNASVTRVCYEVGFKDISYFARMFRRYMGVSPSAYREAYGKSGSSSPAPTLPLNKEEAP